MEGWEDEVHVYFRIEPIAVPSRSTCSHERSQYRERSRYGERSRRTLVDGRWAAHITQLSMRMHDS